MKPLVSICIPAYNSSVTIEKTIHSIQKQTYEKLEIIVVDDQSKDDTVNIVRRLSLEDPRIQLYENPKNLGMTGNWNKCLSLCNGVYIKLICADDLLEPNAIELETKVLEKYPNVGLVESDTRLVDIYGRSKGRFRRYFKSGVVDGKTVAKYSLLGKNFFGAPVNNLIRKSCLEKTGGFDENFTYILDFDLWIRLACCGDVYIIRQLLNRFCIRNDSNTGVLIGQKRQVYVDEHKRLLKKHAKTLGISSKFCRISVMIRKIRNVMIGIYLKLFAK